MVRRPSETSKGKDEPDLPPNIFVVGLLHDLKRGGYSWQAWGAFWRASWIRSMQIFGLNDELRASWLRFTVVGVLRLVLAAAGGRRPFGLTPGFWILRTSLRRWCCPTFELP